MSEGRGRNGKKLSTGKTRLTACRIQNEIYTCRIGVEIREIASYCTVLLYCTVGPFVLEEMWDQMEESVGAVRATS